MPHKRSSTTPKKIKCFTVESCYKSSLRAAASKKKKPGALGSPDDALKAGNLTCEIALRWLTAKFDCLQARQDFSVVAEKQLFLFLKSFKQLLEVMKGTWCTVPNL